MMFARIAAAVAASALTVAATVSSAPAELRMMNTPALAWKNERLAGVAPALLAAGRIAAPPQQQYVENRPYDGRFTMARIRFTPSSNMGEFGNGRPDDVKWDHDYPRGETHYMKILDATTLTEPYTGGGNIFTTDDPNLMEFPFAYMCEPGFWTQNDKEAAGMRNWLLKGGFLIVDDFRGQDYVNFYTQIKRVLPEAQLIDLDVSMPVFHSFFEVASLDIEPPYARRFRPRWFGIFEDNDRSKRLMVAVSYNNDISEYWEWSDTGTEPIVATNEAYKVGVDYAVYAMTH